MTEKFPARPHQSIDENARSNNEQNASVGKAGECSSRTSRSLALSFASLPLSFKLIFGVTMKVKQLELDLWDVISTARQAPEVANFLMVFELLDLTLVDLDTRSQLRIAGEAVCQIADLFCDRSSFLFEDLHSRAVKGEPIMADDAFDRYVRQSMVVDFDQFIEPLQSLPRKIPEQTKHGNSMVGAIDKEVLIQALEQESLLSVEEEFERAIPLVMEG
jgi:hypothetical protein